MATGGQSLKQTQIKASDGVVEFPCSYREPSQNVEAEKFCTVCGEYLCSKCLEHHRSFSKRTPHELKDKADFHTLGLVTKCATHTRKTIYLFCSNHDEVCCTGCLDDKHAACTKLEYLPKPAKDASKSKELTEIKQSLNGFYEDLEQMRLNKNDNQKSLQQDLEKEKTKIKTLKKELIKKVEDTERKDEMKLNANHHTKMKTICEQAERLNKMKEEIKIVLNKLETSNDNEIFIHMKNGGLILENLETRLQEIEPLQRETTLFEIHEKFVELSKIESFGEFRDPKYKGETEKKYSVKAKSDKTKCSINGICKMEDETFVITDSGNINLKWLEPNYQVRATLYLGDIPEDMCRTDKQEVAVAQRSSKRIQFVSVSTTMTLSKTIDVGECCRGICCKGEKIYVTCGGGGPKEGRGQMKVYEKNGNILFTIMMNGNQPIFDMPTRLTADCLRLYVADKRKGIVVLNRQGQMLFTITDDLLIHPDNVSVGNQGDVFICETNSNKVIHCTVKGKKGKLYKIAIPGMELTQPRSVFWDNKNETLIIGMENEIVVTKLSQC